jgi:hypothetical protein
VLRLISSKNVIKIMLEIMMQNLLKEDEVFSKIGLFGKITTTINIQIISSE